MTTSQKIGSSVMATDTTTSPYTTERSLTIRQRIGATLLEAALACISPPSVLPLRPLGFSARRFAAGQAMSLAQAVAFLREYETDSALLTPGMALAAAHRAAVR